MFLLPFQVSYKVMKLAVKSVVWAYQGIRRHAPAWQSMAIPHRPQATIETPVPASLDNVIEEASATFHTRIGDGFKVVFSLKLDTHTIQPVVWLDFARLKVRLGEEAALDMQNRLGQLPSYALSQGRRLHWGRLELPEVPLNVRSSRETRARTFMLDTLDAIERMIAEGGRALVSGHWDPLPKGDDPMPVQQSLSLKPHPIDSSEGRKPRADVVCIGYLLGTGVAERKDAASGRTYQVFYADIDLGGGRRVRQTGADLERALREAAVKPGDKVRLEQFGTVPVNGGRFRRKVWAAEIMTV